MDSLLKSDILVNSYSKIGDENPKIRRFHASQDSGLDDQDRVGLLEGNYIGEMNYSFKHMHTRKPG